MRMMARRVKIRESRVSEFSPLMLTIARESRKASQTALAKGAGITQSAVSQMESGLISPTDQVAERLAAELGYRPSLFYVSHRFQQLPLTFFRKKAKVGARDVHAIRARVNLFRLRIETLLKSFDLASPKLALANLASDGLAAAEAAARLRTYWNLRPGPIKDLTALVEGAGIIVVPMDFGTAAVDGLSIYEPNDVVPPMIFINYGVPADRWRMTIAHELGHIILHHHLDLPPADKDLEDEAWEFAAEFLMPRREISGQLTRVSMHRLAALKKHWRVAMAALLKRAVSLGHVSKRAEKHLWIQLRRGGPREPVAIDPEQAALLRSMVKYHLEELDYSVRELSEIVHLRPEEFRAEFGLTQAPLRLA